MTELVQQVFRQHKEDYSSPRRDMVAIEPACALGDRMLRTCRQAGRHRAGECSQKCGPAGRCRATAKLTPKLMVKRLKTSFRHALTVVTQREQVYQLAGSFSRVDKCRSVRPILSSSLHGVGEARCWSPANSLLPPLFLAACRRCVVRRRLRPQLRGGNTLRRPVKAVCRQSLPSLRKRTAVPPRSCPRLLRSRRHLQV